MYAKVIGSTIVGIDGVHVDIEVDLANGLPQFQIVGLPDSAIRESKERVRAAIKNSEYSFPMKRITINLAPADIKKEGSGFDLPMAIGILLASGQIDENPPISLDSTLFIGELSLDGTLNKVNGILPMVLSAKQKGIKTIIVPNDSIEEAELVDNLEIYGFDKLHQIIQFLNHKEILKPIISYEGTNETVLEESDLDFLDVKGHFQVKRAIEIAVAGMHNLLLIGPPGSGKSMIAKRIPTVLPKLTKEEMLEVTKIYSVAGELNERKLVTNRPFRSPHHSISSAGLMGGGSIPRPGEISLSHRGILFLDELPEFPRSSLESLRQPLEDGKVSISRAKVSMTFPSSVMLIGAMNPCKCGYYGTDVPNHTCTCAPSEVQRYKSKISGPLLDRIDIQIEVPWVNIETLRDKKKEKSSSDMRKEIEKARTVQRKRFSSTKTQFNSEMTSKQVKKYCVVDERAEYFLLQSFDKIGLSGRSLDRILKISRTIADIENSEIIQLSHIAEAMNYRILDRG